MSNRGQQKQNAVDLKLRGDGCEANSGVIHIERYSLLSELESIETGKVRTSVDILEEDIWDGTCEVVLGEL